MEIEKYHRSFKLNFDQNDIVKSNNNEYLSLDHDNVMFIRNFCAEGHHVDIDETFSVEESELLNANVLRNKDSLNINLHLERYKYHSLALLVGKARLDSKDILERSKKALVVGINESLKEHGEKMDLYMCNNPYDSAMLFLPDRLDAWPDGVFAYRINSKFLNMYKGTRCGFGTPMSTRSNSIINVNRYMMCLEDHRSIVLSAFDLIFRLGIKNLVLIDVENYLSEERPGSVYIKNEIYMYPQQIVQASIMSAGAFWLRKYGINVFTVDKNFDMIGSISVIDRDSKIINGEV